MHPNSPRRRVHSAELKAKILIECRRPGASITAVAVAHGLNPNVVHKWLAGQGLKRAGLATPEAARAAAALQFVPIELTRPARAVPPGAQPAQTDIRLDREHGALLLKLRCPASAGAFYATLLRSLADAVAAG
jgi:transposase